MKRRGRQAVWGLVAFLIVVGLLWRQVFLMTGILWWQAPRPVTRPAPPPAAVFPPVNTGWIDLDTYLSHHPVWPM
jgi:hypothetical protein